MNNGQSGITVRRESCGAWMIDLWPHQEVLKAKYYNELKYGYKHVLIQAATGFGKTAVATSIIRDLHTRGDVCAFVVPRKALIIQMAASLKDAGIDYGFVASGYPSHPYKRAYICSALTLVNKLDSIKPKYVFIDEAHIGAVAVNNIIEHYKALGAYIVLLSATPKRLDGKGLGMWAQRMVCGNSTRWLIDNGYLSDYKLYAPSSPDLTGVKTSMGDYVKNQLSAVMEADNVLIGDAIEHYKKLCGGKRAAVFCTSVRHSEQVAKAFTEAGIPAAHMDGETPDVERASIIKRFADGDIKVICNVEILTTGFDLAMHAGRDVTVEAIIMLRPTQSLALYLQIIGRGLRRKPEPCIILDHAGNTMRHGLPCEDREWTLEDSKKGKRGEMEQAIRVRECHSCYMPHKPAPRCPNCGFIYEVAGREITQIAGELREIVTRLNKTDMTTADMDKETTLLMAREVGYPSFLNMVRILLL